MAHAVLLVKDTPDDVRAREEESEPSGEERYDYVDETCGSSSKGTHSFFPAQQYGPDGIKDTLLEEIITSGGDINDTVVDSLEFDDVKGKEPCIVQVSGDIYAIAYSGDGDDGYLKTVEFLRTQNYELDLEIQWIAIDYDEVNEWLCIYGGMMGDEDILVDVWYDNDWITVFTDLSSGWNSVDVSSYLTSSTFRIRFRGGIEMGDSTQDSWEIDATFLHVWT